MKESVRVNREDGDEQVENMVSIDTTVQEKNITYPTDDKQYKKIIRKCWKISDEESINLRQSYVRIVKSLGITQRLKPRKNGAKKARKTSKRIKIIVGRLL